MEPITLCGALIVAFGLWMEFEGIVKKVLNAAVRSRIWRSVLAQASVQKPACANRYVVYSR